MLIPDATETKGQRRSFLKCLPGRRVMYCALHDSAHVITAYFDRTKTMRVRVDHKADAVYLNLTDHEIAESEEVADGIVVDYDAEGRIVGLGDPRRVAPDRRS